MKKSATTPNPKRAPLYTRIREILASARSSVARSVNTTQVVANWLIGREIVEEEQRGRKRASYGEQLLEDLSVRLRADFGRGYSADNLEMFRRFYLEYGDLISDAARRISPALGISDAPRRKSLARSSGSHPEILQAPRGGFRRAQMLSPASIGDAVLSQSETRISHALRSELEESWKPGVVHPNLSWTHYRRLLRVSSSEVRAFYEIEAIKNNWGARELERQINSLLFERLARSRDKAGLMRMATRGQEIDQPADIFKDPVVIEFLGLLESPRLVETQLEEALIENLQAFLLELGRGFAFVARQKRITLDGDHFYIDLVFYHAILKCFVVIDLKVGKLTHQDLGQLQLYVNYFDREISSADDNPTLGLILCTDKNDAVVKYTLGPEQEKKIFASRYKLYLPTEAELQDEIKRELKALDATETVRGKRTVASTRTRKRRTR